MRSLLLLVLVACAAPAAAPPPASPPPAEPEKAPTPAPPVAATTCESSNLEEVSDCEERAGHLIAALKTSQKALGVALTERDTEGMKRGRSKVKSLLDRLPHVTFTPVAGVTDVVVRVDDRQVPADSLTRKFSIDPGKHNVVATGQLNGRPGIMNVTFDAVEGQTVAVPLDLDYRPIK